MVTKEETKVLEAVKDLEEIKDMEETKVLASQGEIKDLDLTKGMVDMGRVVEDTIMVMEEMPQKVLEIQMA